MNVVDFKVINHCTLNVPIKVPGMPDSFSKIMDSGQNQIRLVDILSVTPYQ